MKKVLIIIPLTIIAAACAPMYGTSALPGGGYPPAPYRVPYQPPSNVNPVPIGRWSNVMMLPRGAEIAVVTNEGRVNVGNFLAATNELVWMVSRAGETEIPAESIARVDLMRGGHSTMARDAVAGGALGAGAVGLLGLAGGRMPPARLFAAGAIFGAYEAGEWGRQVNARTSMTVYLAPPPRQQ